MRRKEKGQIVKDDTDLEGKDGFRSERRVRKGKAD